MTTSLDTEFERHRSVLLGISYRMLGSFADAEDVVQDAWIRWAGVDHDTVSDPRRFLITIVSRLAIDRMRLAHRKRETYVGPWLPEPVRTDREELGPADTAQQRDTLSVATLRLMERLSAPERAVFVLREAFELPYDEIGEVLSLTAANARQLHRRAGARLTADRERFATDPGDHRDLVDRFIEAARTGDRNALQALFAQDVTMWTDGGGKSRAALRPVRDADRVARFLMGVLGKYDEIDLTVIEVNGLAAMVLVLGEYRQIISLEISDGLVTGVQMVSNPDKLTRALS
ncbi:RNA polymerase sigma-70 factor, ECF subfamily [Actinokineospora alba]|uniref:RNA polymerase sigma-70 factor, ECF subfamily n=1 Tax=Actinokineospora alba TaxID=504798 RepID=A0A1H0GHQ5_9PSEU|nr:RNA polymerase sigma factor SigJ [Actinokineospora alba]TDP69900.1 RNA polymerase sigma-70 factor (ECF subfamily) [Actinokineospora alba]SDI06341.1 RNA polymerase sigma-70 factor, ECF subfamily [Actinokineospora alba]SDO06373.1 RNA polymerase sigma-70 factor, ECF subfamily [Actinokineospora alba]